MEWFWLSLVFGLALSMDCLALAIIDGLTYSDLDKKKSFFIAAVFAIGQGLFPLIGFALGQAFSSWIDEYDHWIAFVLLLAIGGKMSFEGIKGIIKPEEKTTKKFSYGEAIVQGVADSIDALAIGITIRTNIHATADYQVFVAFGIIALVTFIVAIFGLMAGKKIDKLLKGRDEASQLLGGMVLIALGTLILLEGLAVIG
jgi:manganese efflux pump family protein